MIPLMWMELQLMNLVKCLEPLYSIMNLMMLNQRMQVLAIIDDGLFDEYHQSVKGGIKCMKLKVTTIETLFKIKFQSKTLNYLALIW